MSSKHGKECLTPDRVRKIRDERQFQRPTTVAEVPGNAAGLEGIQLVLLAQISPQTVWLTTVFCTDEALLLYAQISALPEPRSSNMACLRGWLTDTRYAPHCINGAGADAWGALFAHVKPPPCRSKIIRQFLRNTLCPWLKPNTDEALDLVAPRPPSRIDGFARWMQEECIPFCETWHDAKGPHSHDDEQAIDIASVGREGVGLRDPLNMRATVRPSNVSRR
jgi:hypothetical protein